jgi:hypothetical protein
MGLGGGLWGRMLWGLCKVVRRDEDGGCSLGDVYLGRNRVCRCRMARKVDCGMYDYMRDRKDVRSWV